MPPQPWVDGPGRREMSQHHIPRHQLAPDSAATAAAVTALANAAAGTAVIVPVETWAFAVAPAIVQAVEVVDRIAAKMVLVVPTVGMSVAD